MDLFRGRVMMWEKELKVAKELAVDAGHAIMEIYNRQEEMDVIYKEDSSPLTMADQKSNDIIVSGLKKTFPSYAVLSEEEKNDLKRLNNECCFIVDPLDGTKEFIKRNGQFTVNIALSYKNHSVIGVIYVPVTEELYFASKDSGSYMQKHDGRIEKLLVSDRIGYDNIRMVMSQSHGCIEMEQLMEKYRINNFIKIGSSLKGCMVARGDAEVYYRFNPTMEWDTAAMQCIAEEAGAVFRQMDDTEMTYNRLDSINSKGFYIINSMENKLVL